MIPKTMLLTGALAMAPAFAAVFADEISSLFGVDAPELAHVGEFAVGTRTLHLIHYDQVDILAFDAASGTAPRRDRALTVDLWYPARPKPGAAAVVYTASLPSEPPAPPARFAVPGMAVRDAAAAGTGYPLVVVSHGYSNDPAAMTWITENLASKGYVVAAIHHDDPPITDRTQYAGPVLRRPLDIVFVAETLEKILGDEHLIDPSRLALIGYSQGGYGVLTAAGATLDPAGSLTQAVPGGFLKPYVRGAPLQAAMRVKGLRAVVAISPAGGGKNAAWGPSGMLGITAPLLLIAGDADRTVNYATGARAFFDTALNAQRFLLTFKGAGHAIGLGAAPVAMRKRLWDQDWFEDPVWSKERLNAIEAHFITAFLGRYLKGDEAFASYLDVPVLESSAGVWPDKAPPSAYDAFSPGSGDITVWKGFQRKHAEGLELLQAAPASP
ncbi:MAG: alpha/beta hydrolase family protein [Steroidobacteraceae bacterium]